MKDLARLPFSHNTWLGYGHTMANEPGDYAEGTGFCGIVLDCAEMFGQDFAFLPTGDESGICFYYMIPLYKEELDFKMKHGADKLLKKLYGGSFIIDIHRKNTCGKGFGLFR